MTKTSLPVKRVPDAGRTPLIDPVDQFRARLLSMMPGETYVYHRGRLATDRKNTPSVNLIAMMAHGLQMLGAVEISQKRQHHGHYDYQLRISRPIRNVDFDHGRKVYLENWKEES